MDYQINLSNTFLKETQRLIQEPVEGIQAVPDEANARYFHVLVLGPKDVCNLLSFSSKENTTTSYIFEKLFAVSI